MEQITQYFEHMDYVSFGVIALPCVIIAVYGFLQVASGLAKGKNDKMQRYNNNGNSSSNNNNNNSGGKRCTQKYANGNIAAGTTAGNATAATAAATTVANSYQQTNSNSNNNNNSGSKSNNATRKARYNNHNNNNKRHEAGNAAYNLQQKRSNVVAAGADAQTWHRFVTSSCIEEKFLGQHNPGHRNSTSSEATSEDINSSDEHSGKSKSNRSGSGSGANGGSGSGSGNNAAAGGGGNNSGSGGKSRSKRQQKAQSALKQSLNRTPAMVPGQLQGQTQQVQQPLEQQATAKASGKCSSSKQGKWRNSASSCNSGANQKRGSSSNNKSKQTKCQSGGGGGNGKSAGSSSNNHSVSNHNSNNHHSSNSNVNSLTKSSGNYSSSSGGSNSSSALSSPGSSPNSSSSSGNSSSHSLNSLNGTAATSSWSRNQHKIYRQNANFLVPPLRQYEHIELDDAALQQQLQRYLIEPHLLRVYGFPVESVVHEGAIEIFKCLPHMSFAAAHCMAVTETVMTVINCHDGLNTNNFEEEPTSSSSLSSGNEASTSTDSGNISPRSLDSESAGEWSGSECESSNELYCNYDAPEEERSLAKQCVRCKQDFLVDELSGQYLTRDECSYHWGKYHRCYDGSAWVSRWTCCSSSDESDIGCTRHELHVWTGSVVGVNGPYRDFVHTRPRANANANGQTQTRAVYALDCEMSYTGRGLDVTKVSLVALNGQLVYEHYVRPDADIVDYNTRYSGVTAKDLKSCGVKTLAEVQRDLLELIDADTILIGHGLDNDLRALRLVHNTLIDTSIAFPHSSGFPYRRALRHLTKTHLNREIQSGDGATGHSSFEDSRACMELMLWRVRCELDSDGSWED